ncbi:MAG: energy-coupling factor transporter ATPase [Clostridiales Family XIII bacterium]|jgi:energy-coupling factor transport system ATP-binding protein|nr:energy-coupling factor transporter ATPase [Clostridiales Family XIII bacterium]
MGVDGLRYAENDSIIRIEDLVFAYGRENEDAEADSSRARTDATFNAVDRVSIRVERGSFTSVIGRNGSGKSTLAKNINALLLPTGGRAFVAGFDTADETAVWEIRQRVGMVFQNPDNQLVSAVVEDDVAFGPENLGVAPEEIRERIRVSLSAVDMYEHRKMAPHLLSGGQKQRVAIAGVLAMKPEIIIFDEPTAMLDPEGRAEVMDIIKRLHDEKITVVLITHFMEETVTSDRIVIMDCGRVAMEGTPAEIFARSDEIESLGLKLPFVVELSARLRERGVPVPSGLLTEEALSAHLLALNGKARN